MSDIDPPWRTDPLQNIINVNWGDRYRLVAFILGQPTKPEYVVQFTSPKTFYTAADLGAQPSRVPVPHWGSQKPWPTATQSPNYSIPNGLGSTTLTGDSLITLAGDGKIDWRGYTTVKLFRWVNVSTTGLPFFIFELTGEKQFFNYKGKKVDKIPDDSAGKKKGLAVASDDEGTIYVLGGGDPARSGITKYDKDGNKLWFKPGGPDACNYDAENKRIVVVYGPFIDTYDLSGNLVSEVSLNDEIDWQEASRKGKIYGYYPKGHFPQGIKGYDAKGQLLFTIAVPVITDAQFQTIAAYGEDYFVVSMHQIGPSESSGSRTITRDIYSIRIYNAKTGAMISDDPWADTVIDVYDQFSPGPIELQILNEPSYGFTFGAIRNAYFPNAS